MLDSINVRDAVQLKSGGPKMTVISVGELNGVPTVWCEWFEGFKSKSATFNLDLLKRV
jgi:uncharacterized protein YodC (DUF2158 family)